MSTLKQRIEEILGLEKLNITYDQLSKMTLGEAIEKVKKERSLYEKKLENNGNTNEITGVDLVENKRISK